MAWRQQTLPLFGCWCFQGVERAVVVLVGCVLSGPVDIPGALARRPTWLWLLGQILSCLRTPALFFGSAHR